VTKALPPATHSDKDQHSPSVRDLVLSSFTPLSRRRTDVVAFEGPFHDVATPLLAGALPKQGPDSASHMPRKLDSHST